MAAGASDTPKLLTRQDLAYRLGVNPQTVAKWIEEGLPVAERGKGRRPSRYEEASARRWVDAREKPVNGKAPNLVAARARKELAQAIEAEQRVALRAGKLIPIEEVDKVWSGQVAAIRARLLAWPTTLSDRLHRVAAIEGPAGVERILLEAAHDTLRELAADATKPKRRKRRRVKARSAKTRPAQTPRRKRT